MAGKSLAEDKMVLGQLEWYLDQHYAFRTDPEYRGLLGWLRAKRARATFEAVDRSTGEEHEWRPGFYASDPFTYEEALREYKKRHAEDNFALNLMRLIERKQLDHVAVYKKARIDRKLFSKIRSNPDYIPGKKTVLALVLAMELNLDEGAELLKKAGYSFSPYILFDVIIQFFITQKIFDIDAINSVLHKYQQQIF